MLELEQALVQDGATQSVPGRILWALNLPQRVWILKSPSFPPELSLREDRRRKQQHLSLRHSLILQSAFCLDCKNVSPPFFNQWKLNYPDSWATLEYINIFWQAWLRPHPPSALFFSSALAYPGPSALSSAFPSVFLCCVNVALTMILISHCYRPAPLQQHSLWKKKRQGQTD